MNLGISDSLYYNIPENFRDDIPQTAPQEHRQENMTSDGNSNISTETSLHTLPITADADETEGQGNYKIIF